ncbi:MAG: hypothetical protein PHQ86_08260 [Dehalococcoidales bacterium]|nr:hypothetical protein [Dehalococcoidales bacterium]
MAPSLEYPKVMTEIVYINLPGPEEPEAGMSGPEILHGFLADLHQTANAEVKAFIDAACLKWNVHFRVQK